MKSILDAMNLSLNPEKFFDRKQTLYGSSFDIKLPGTEKSIFTGTPDGARELFSLPSNMFSAPKDNPISPIVGENSLILLGEERHLNEKKKLTPFFFGKIVEDYKEVISNTLENDFEHLMSRNEGRVQLLATTQDMTLNIIIAIIFGIQDRGKREEFKKIIQKYIASYHPTLMFFPILRRKSNPYWNRFKSNEQQFHHAILKLFDQNIDANSMLHHFNSHYDDKKQVIDQLKTMLIAGHETTAIGLFWAIFYLLENPIELKKLEEEIRGISEIDLFSNKYIESVCYESMRIHPAVPIVLRTLNQDFRFLNYDVKKGENIGLALTLLHHNRDIFPSPEQFLPERFMGKSYKNFEFAPFGGGNRKCIGSNLALVEMKLFLYKILKKANIEKQSKSGVKPIIKGITMSPGSDIWISFKK